MACEKMRCVVECEGLDGVGRVVAWACGFSGVSREGRIGEWIREYFRMGMGSGCGGDRVSRGCYGRFGVVLAVTGPWGELKECKFGRYRSYDRR